MNINFKDSFADRKMKISSTLSVTESSNDDIFTSMLIFMPLSFASANIVNFSAAVDAKTPAVLAVTVDNYADVLQGDLLAQWKPIFRDDTNVDVVLYVCVFYDTDTEPTMWAYGTKSITFTPLTTAFNKLFTIAYLKFMFDPTYDGSPVPVAGTKASGTLTFANGGSSSRTLAAGTYTFSDGTKTWTFTLSEDKAVSASGSLTGVAINATTVGATSGLSSGATIVYSTISPSISSDFTITVTSFTNGTAASTKSSVYFDMALALAYQCSNDIKLSCCWDLARLDLTKVGTTDTNYCWIRSKTAAEEAQAMTSLSTGDRAKYFWGAHKLMGTENTFVAADIVSEDRYLFAIVLATWFASTNATGLYVGNKLSLLRLANTNCFGLPSSLNALYNENDGVGFAIFDDKNVGYLTSISSSSYADSLLSACRGVTGFPIGALMIEKYADYTTSNDLADLISDTGTLTDPVLTDATAYAKIQNIALNNVSQFTKIGSGRISNVVSKFPSFDVAKVSSTALKAATAWSANYVDDLDSVTITGGLTA